MAFLWNWRLRCVQQMKWAGLAFLTMSHLNHGPYGKLQGFLLSPPLNQASPAFAFCCLLSQQLSTFVSFFSPPLFFPAHAHLHKHTLATTHTHAKPPKHSPAEHLQGWVPDLGNGQPLCISQLSVLRLPPSQTSKQRYCTHPHLYSLPHIFPPASLSSSFGTSLAQSSLYGFLAWPHGCSIWALCSHAWSDVTRVRLRWFVLSPHSLPRRRAVPAVLESLFCLGKVSVCEILLWLRGWGYQPSSSVFYPFNVLCWCAEDFHNFCVISVLHSSDTKNIWHYHV